MATVHNGSLPSNLSKRLRQLELRIRKLALMRGLGLLALLLAVGIGFSVLVDLKWELSVGLRSGMLAAIGLCAGWVTLRYIVWPCVAKISQAELATIVEQSHPELAERLSSTVELNDPSIPKGHRGSALMQELLTRQTLSATTSLAFSESVSNQRSLRATLVGIVAVLLLMVPFLFSPQGYGLLWQRFFSPWGNFESGGNLYFEVENGYRIVARGSDVLITATPHWRQSVEERPQTVWLNWSDSTGESDSRRMDFHEESETYVTTLPHIFDPFDFDIAAGRARTQRFHVSVEEAPAVTSATLDVQPPAYTGMNALHHDGVIGEIYVYDHSSLTFRLLFNKPVNVAELVWTNENQVVLQKNDGQPENPRENQPEDALRRPPVSFVLSADRKSAELETTAKIGGRFLFLLTDEHKLHNQQEPRRVLVITPDAAPLIELAGSDQPRMARSTDRVVVDVLVTDDMGVTELELHYDIFNGHQGMLTVEAAELGGQTITHQFDLDLSSLGLAEGDAVTYRIRAADERPVPGPNESWSVIRVLTISENAKSLNSNEIAEIQNTMQQGLDAIREELKKIREQVADLQKTAQSNLQQEKPFQRNDELPELGQKQFQLAKRLERLSWDFAQHPLYQNLTQRMQEVSRKDLPEASQTIRQAASDDAGKKIAGLKQNENQLQQAETKLKDIAGTFDELAALERDLLDLNRLAEEAEQLAQNLRDLENMLNNPPKGETPQQKQAREQETAQQQQALQQQQQQQKEELDDLLKRRPELLEAARQQQLKQLAELARRLLQLAEPEELLAETLQEEAQRPAADSGKQPETPSDPSNAQNQNPQQPDARQAQSQQQKLARDAAQLALDVARQMGPGSLSAQKAAEFARESFTSRGQSSVGRFDRASKSAQQASALGQQVAEVLGNTEGSPSSPETRLQRRAEALAQQQQQMAQHFERLNQSPQARREGQQAGQQRLSLSTKFVADRLNDAAKKLSSEPLNLGPQGLQAQAAGSSANQAQQSMQQAQNKLSEKNPASASQQAQQAAEKLRLAAQLATQAAGESAQSQSPVPGNVGEQLAEAFRKFAEAQQQLEQARQNQKKGQQKNGKPSQQGQQSKGDPSQQKGDPPNNPLAQSADSMEQAAKALAQAAQKLQLGQQGKNQQSKSQQPGKPGQSTGDNANGAQVDVDLSELESALEQLSGREWGQLPGRLKTEILQAAQKRPNSDYSKLIKLYFEEIAKTNNSERAAINQK